MDNYVQRAWTLKTNFIIQTLLSKIFKTILECFGPIAFWKNKPWSQRTDAIKWTAALNQYSTGDLVLFQFLTMIALVFSVCQLLSVDELPNEQPHFHIWLNSDYITSVYHNDCYRPQTKVRKGNVFTGVCLSMGEVYHMHYRTGHMVGCPPYIRPENLPPLLTHLVVITGDLFKLILLKTFPPTVLTSGGGTETQMTSGQYASYWNVVLVLPV